MNTFFRRCLALVLALSLVLSCCTAYAVELSQTEKAENLSILSEDVSLSQSPLNQSEEIETAALTEEASQTEMTAETDGNAVQSEAADTEEHADEAPEEEPILEENPLEAFFDELLEEEAAAEEKEIPLANAAADYIKETELFVYIGRSLTPTFVTKIPENALFTSSDTDVVTVDETTGKLKAVGIGRAVITLMQDETKLDSLTIYGYQYTTYTEKTNKNADGSKNESSPLTVTNTTGSTVRTYQSYVQSKQYDEGGHKIGNLASHGCAICSISSLAQGYGLKDVDPVWMQQEGFPLLADKLGVTLGNALGTGGGGMPIGLYGMKQMLSQLGISTKINTWSTKTKDDAILNMTQALSEGRPLVVVVYSNSWNGIQLAGAHHFLLLTGIDKDGNVLYLNSSNGHVNYSVGATRKVTVSQLVSHFVDTTRSKRTDEKDFYYALGPSSCMVYLEAASANAGTRKLKCSGKESITKATITLSKTSAIYTGKAITPTVTVKMGSKKLVEGTDFTYWHNNNTKVGTATTTIRGMGDYTGLMQKTFTIAKQSNTITAANQSLAASTKAQTVALGATAEGDAKLTYASSDSSVTVSSAGKITIPANYGGKVTITITAAETSTYAKTTKKVTITVTGANNTITVSNLSTNASESKQTVTLNATVRDSAAVTFSSADKSITVTAAGKVTIPAAYSGKATITVATAATTYFKATSKSFTFTVNKKDNSIEVADQTLLREEEERTIELQCRALSAAAITYTSASNDISVTSEGVVTIPAGYVGEAVIKAEAPETVVYKAATGSINLRVVKPGNTITAANKSATASSGKKKIQLTATAQDGAAITYSTTSKYLTLNKETGLVTLDAGYVGTATITVTAAETEQYAETTKKVTISVKPAAVKVTYAKSPSGKKVKCKWSRNSLATGYQLQYATKSSFSNKKTVTLKGSKSLSKTVSGLKKKTKYYVRVRSYRTFKGTTVYSAWSGVKKVTTKKK